MAAVGRERIQKLIKSLLNEKLRGGAMVELAFLKKEVVDMGPIFWHSFGVMAVLLQVGLATLKCLVPSLYVCYKYMTWLMSQYQKFL